MHFVHQNVELSLMIDYKKLLMKYIHAIGEYEGTNFLSCIDDEIFSQEEFAELIALADELKYGGHSLMVKRLHDTQESLSSILSVPTKKLGD
jgi:hypothetical protein